jgi:hypothetical protein
MEAVKYRRSLWIPLSSWCGDLATTLFAIIMYVSIIFLVCMPCGHLCICGDAVCIASVMDPQQCPYCQERADQVLEVVEAKAELERAGGRLYTV